jgi:hypothetical protein
VWASCKHGLMAVRVCGETTGIFGWGEAVKLITADIVRTALPRGCEPAVGDEGIDAATTAHRAASRRPTSHLRETRQ